MYNFLKVAATAFCVMALASTGHTQETQADPQRQIVVVGTGSVTATPDILTINLVVQAEAIEASDAIRQMSAELDNVLSTLRGAGLAAGDIQTAGLRLSPRHTARRDGAEQPELAGFIASSDITIVVRNVADSGRVLDAVVEAGANYINGLQFDVAARDTLLEQARGAAVADAMAKTSLYATAAELRTGNILSIEEGNVAGNGPRSFQGIAARDVPIALGTLEISAQVTMVTAVQ